MKRSKNAEWNAETFNTIYHLRKQGFSPQEIAKRLHMGIKTYYKMIEKMAEISFPELDFQKINDAVTSEIRRQIALRKPRKKGQFTTED